MAYGCICIKNTDYGIRKGVRYGFSSRAGRYMVNNGNRRHVYTREEFIQLFSIVDFVNEQHYNSFVEKMNDSSELDFMIQLVQRSQENYPYRTITEHLQAIKNILERPVDSLNQTIAA